MSSSTLDIIGLLFLGLMVYRGWRAGLIHSVMGLAGIALGLFIAVRFGLHLEGYLGSLLPLSDRILSVLNFMIAVGAGVFVVHIAGRVLYRLIHPTPMGLMDTLGGAAIGLIKGTIVLGVLSLMLRVMPLPAAWNLAVHESSAVGVSTAVWSYTVELSDPLLPRQVSLYMAELEEKASRKWQDVTSSIPDLPEQ